MSKLWNKTKNKEVLSHVEIANTSLTRMRGLLGRKSLDPGHGLLIVGEALLPANSVHTFFMKFAIDLIFLDDQNRVVAVEENVRPWRMVLPVWKARSVVESAPGIVREKDIGIGDEFHVVS